ncbi:MAG: aldolase, partial [Hyphomicrobiales bacterium]
MHPVFARGTSDTAALGGWITIDSPTALEVMAGAGFDYLCIDAQHSLIGVIEAARLLHCADREGPPVLVRVPANNAADIGKLLDCGAAGVIVPMVENVEQAHAAARACTYAAGGVRSFGPIRRDLPRRPAELAEAASCFVMIETGEGVRNATVIAAVSGIAGLYLG